MTLKNILKKLIGFSLPTYIGALLSIISIPVITRIFSPGEIGKINLLIAYVNTLLIFCTMGYDQAFIRFYYDYDKRNQTACFAGSCLKISLACWGFISLLLLLFYRFVSINISGDSAYIIVIMMIIILLSRLILQYTTIISRMEQDIKLYSIQSIFSIIASKCVYIIAVFWHPLFYNAIFIMTGSNLLLCILFTIYFLKIKKIDLSTSILPNELRKLSSYAIPTVPAFIISTINIYLSQFILRKYANFAEIGIYANAVSMANVISLVQAGFNIYWPSFVYANYQTQQAIIKKIHRCVIFTMTTFALFIILCQDILYLAVGEDFRCSKFIFPILIVIPVIYTIGETTRIGVRIAQKTYYEFINTFIIIAINILLSILLVPKFSILGAAASSAISAVSGVFIISYFSNRFYKIIDSYIPLVLSVFLLSLACIFNFIENNFVTKISIISLIIINLLYYRDIVKNIYIYVKNFMEGI